MKVFHAADLHYSPKHLDHVDRCFGCAIDRAIEEGCKLAVIAGDSFDSSMGIHEPAYLAYLHQVHRLADSMPVVVLQGTHSHDRLGALGALKVRNDGRIVVADKTMGIGVRRGQLHVGGIAISAMDAVVFALPSLNKADPAVRELGPRGWVEEQMRGFAAVAKECRDYHIPTVLTSHGTVTGCRTESQYAMISPDLEFDDITLYSSGADLIALGHIHERQIWSNDRGQVIAYPASVSRLVHGHMSPVGALVHDVRSGAVATTPIDTPAPKLLEASFPGEPDWDDLEELAQQVDDNTRVRIRYEVDEDKAHMVDRARIEAMFAWALSLRIEPTVHPVTSVRSEGIGRATTMFEKLMRVAETTGDEDNIEELDAMAAMLKEMDVENIAKEVIGK